VADVPGERAARAHGTTADAPAPAAPQTRGPSPGPRPAPVEPPEVGVRRVALTPTMVPLHRRSGLRRSLRATPTGSVAPDGDERPTVLAESGVADAAGNHTPPAEPVAAPLIVPPRAPLPPRDRWPDGLRAADDPDLAWAATSTVLAALGARMDAWRRSWTWARILRAATASAAVLVVLVLGLAWGATSWVEAAIRDIGALDPDSASIRDAAAQRGDQNYLVVGSDTRVGATPDEAVGDESGIPGARSDTVMIVHVPDDRSRVTVVSFPRDLEIDRPACERWDARTGAYTGGQAPAQSQVKLNTAYQFGGPRCVTKVVQALSGLAVNHFLGLDFQGFKGMVDAVGGVPICVEQPIRDTVLGDVVDRAGPRVLNGNQALDFVRARHVVGDPTSDYGRIQRQQRFLSALLRATLSAGTLLDLSKLRGLAVAVSQSTFGENVGTDQLLSLGRSLGGIDTRTVTFTTLPTTGVANARGNEVLRPGEDRALFSTIIGNRSLPGQAPQGGVPAPPAPAEVRSEQITVRLVDARSSDPGRSGYSDRSGLRPVPRVGGVRTTGPDAAAVAETLRERGFTVVTDTGTGNEPVGGAEAAGSTVIRFSPDEQDAADTLARAVPGARLVPTGGAALLDLVVGDDFNGRVVDPAPVAVPVAPIITAADTACS